MSTDSTLQQDIQKVMRRAFFDAIQHHMDTNPTMAIDWLAQLHKELAARFSAVLPSKKIEILMRGQRGKDLG